MAQLVFADFREALGCLLITGSCCLLGKLSIHRLHLVGFALDRITEIVDIAADQPVELSLLHEVLKVFHMSRPLKQRSQISMPVLAGLPGEQRVFQIGKGLPAHRGEQILLGLLMHLWPPFYSFSLRCPMRRRELGWGRRSQRSVATWVPCFFRRDWVPVQRQSVSVVAALDLHPTNFDMVLI